MKKVKSVVPFIIAFAFMMILCLVRLKVSTYSDMIKNGISYFFMSFIPLFAAYLFFLLINASKRSKKNMICFNGC